MQEDDMLTVEECREHLQDLNLTDDQIIEIRNTLYAMCDRVIIKYLQRSE